jgi:hypothetical protein
MKRSGTPLKMSSRSHFAASDPPGSLGATLKSSLKGLSVAQTNLFVLMSPELNVAPE